MARRDELGAALLDPHEDLSFEYKAWIDLGSTHGKATLAKAIIAMANADGGYVVIGYNEEGDTLRSVPRPGHVREITQDLVNGAVQRFVAPALHVRMEVIENARTGVSHPVVIVPSTTTTPVMASRDYENILYKARVYVRQSGPRSAEPQTVEEWRALLDRCVQRSRASMLDAIRAIVEGRVEEGNVAPALQDRLSNFVTASRSRHDALLDATDIPMNAVSRMPRGHYEVGFAFESAEPTPNLARLRDRIDEAHRIKLTGWPTFLTMTRRELAPYPADGGIEAWLGRPGVEHFLEEDAAHSDFWRIAPDGILYTRTGYDEDGAPERAEPGTAFDIVLPIWRVGEALLFARRIAATYEGVEEIAAHVKWSGLDGRALRAMSRNRMPMSYDRVSRTNEVEQNLAITLRQIDDNLPEVLRALIAPVYEAFDFYELPLQIVEEELEVLMRRN
ncbi:MULTISPECIES: ATP-binding protein [unclassified Yoonia]|uniref:ATP-binding protein n=1 Tax=unclassified Yoonia TaxID=2629118 RepID=UPI002AFE6336|nr:MULTISPECIES: ATP-binding protein [unclassified Yoonia]